MLGVVALTSIPRTQEDPELKANLGYVVSPRPASAT